MYYSRLVWLATITLISHRFAEAQPLFKIFNKKCLKNFIPERNVSADSSPRYLVMETWVERE